MPAEQLQSLFSGSGEIAVTEKKDHNQIMQDFRVRKSRQVRAIAAALLLIIFLAVIYNRPGPFRKLIEEHHLFDSGHGHRSVYRIHLCQLEMPLVQ